ARTARVRVELANAEALLKPGMYGTVQISTGAARETLVVPDSAVIDSGTKQTVLIALGDGRFEPREVKLGARGDGLVEVQSGLKDGEVVVTRANFLIDAESNLKAALGGMQKAEAASPAPVGHRAEGTLNGIDLAAGTVTISHGPVPSLNWPSMKMDFVLANPALVAGIAPGTGVVIEFVERGQGEWVITSLVRK
ncbi:MAG: copper-binding protein, partial [Azonexus sp.]